MLRNCWTPSGQSLDNLLMLKPQNWKASRENLSLWTFTWLVSCLGSVLTATLLHALCLSPPGRTQLPQCCISVLDSWTHPLRVQLSYTNQMTSTATWFKCLYKLISKSTRHFCTWLYFVKDFPSTLDESFLHILPC